MASIQPDQTGLALSILDHRQINQKVRRRDWIVRLPTSCTLQGPGRRETGESHNTQSPANVSVRVANLDMTRNTCVGSLGNSKQSRDLSLFVLLSPRYLSYALALFLFTFGLVWNSFPSTSLVPSTKTKNGSKLV